MVSVTQYGTAQVEASGCRKGNKLRGEWFYKPGSKKSIIGDGIWLYYLEALILNSVWIAHPDVILFQFIQDFIIAPGNISL